MDHRFRSRSAKSSSALARFSMASQGPANANGHDVVAAAARLHTPLTDHATVAQRVEAAVSRIDAGLNIAKQRGDLAFFNAAYKPRRAAAQARGCGFMTYAQATASAAKSRCWRRGARQVRRMSRPKKRRESCCRLRHYQKRRRLCHALRQIRAGTRGAIVGKRSASHPLARLFGRPRRAADRAQHDQCPTPA
jgi:hypothetical protein